MDKSYRFYPVDPLVEHLAAGRPVLTPNHRLARRIKLAWAQSQTAKGRDAWRTPTVMSLEHWWQACYRARRVAGDDLPGLVSPAQERALWLRCVESGESPALLRPRAAATLAAEAYLNLALWNIDWRDAALAQRFAFDEDARVFLAWAAHFDSMLTSLDLTTLPDLIPYLAEHCPHPSLVVAEFDDLPPLHRNALERQADGIVPVQAGDQKAHCSLQPCGSHRGELEAAARWALEQHRADGNRRIGILLPRLQQERRDVERVFHRAFDSDPRRPETLPVNFSAGEPLDRCGPVRAALALLALPIREVTLSALGHALYSRYRDQSSIAAEEDAWLRLASAGRSPVTPSMLRWALDKAVSDTGPAAAPDPAETAPAEPDRHVGSQLPLLGVLLDAGQLRELRAERPAADWPDRFSRILEGLGWPGAGPLDSLEYQQVELFHNTLESLAELEGVVGRIGYAAALAALEDLCSNSIFQAQTPDAPIQVLGVLEAAGLQFDALWIGGMGAGDWPPAPSPSPFVPAAIQRTAGMPHADARRELAYASRLLERLERSTPVLIASYAEFEDEIPVPPSPLVAHYETRDAIPTPRWPPTWEAVGHGIEREHIAVNSAPAVSDSEAERLTGGSAIIGDQAQCPFRAFARHRLGARPLPDPEPALTAAERGGILHEALFHFWGQCESSDRLRSLDAAARSALCENSAAQALASFRRRGGRFHGVALLELEQRRLTDILQRWVDVEAARLPFVVAAREQRYDITLDGLTLTLRIDRIDTLENGRRFVVDYKSGDAKPRLWLGQRPEDPQLPLYTRVFDDAELEGVGFAVLRHDHLGYRGLARSEIAAGVDADIVKATEKTDAPLPDWDALRAHWDRALASLAQEFMAGHTPVQPLDPRRTCTYCGLQALCRVQ